MNRRSFLKTSGLILAGLLLCPQDILRTEEKKKLREVAKKSKQIADSEFDEFLSKNLAEEIKKQRKIFRKIQNMQWYK